MCNALESIGSTQLHTYSQLPSNHGPQVSIRVGRNFSQQMINVQVLITLQVEGIESNKRVGPNKHAGK